MNTLEAFMTNLTHSIEEAYDIINQTAIIDGRVIDEAIRAKYFDTAKETYEDIANHTSKSADALRMSHNAYKKLEEAIIAIKADDTVTDKEDVIARLKLLSEAQQRKLPQTTLVNKRTGKPMLNPKLGYKTLEEFIVTLEEKPTKPTRAFNIAIKSKVYLQAQGRCEICRTWVTWDNYECDHIKPYAKGGESIIENAQCLCRSCNRTKSDR